MQKVASKRQGFVYVIKAIGGRYKIGYSSNPVSRMQEISVSNCGIQLVSVYNGTIEDECNLHKIFAYKHISGEWFDLDKTDLACIGMYFRGKEDIELLRLHLIDALNRRANVSRIKPKVQHKRPVLDLDTVCFTAKELEELEKRKVSIRSAKLVKRFWQEDNSLGQRALMNMTGYCARAVASALSALRAANL